MNRAVVAAATVWACIPGAALAGPPSANEGQVWALEDSYWSYVKANDMERYRMLWRSDFLGWPLHDPEPVHRDHITDWITAHTSVGETLRSYEVERLAAQASANYVTVAYRVRLTWVTRQGVEKPAGLRVLHTWLKGPDAGWQILSGMAAAPDAQGH
jgi:ketosteroid isomerase-like protein